MERSIIRLLQQLRRNTLNPNNSSFNFVWCNFDLDSFTEYRQMIYVCDCHPEFMKKEDWNMLWLLFEIE